MSSPFITPFNFQPASVQVGTGASYTVPTGKYAKVTVNYSLNVAASVSNSATFVDATSLSNGNLSGSIEIWLKSADTLLLAANNTNGSQSVSAGSASSAISVTGIAGLNITIKGILTSIFCRGSSSITGRDGNISALAIPTSTFSWVAQEYMMVT